MDNIEGIDKMGTEIKQKRDIGLDFLRITAMFMVTVLHALGHGGVLEQYAFASFGYILFWAVETLCYVAVNLFVLITGYFMVNSEVKPSRILKLMIQVEFYSLMCLALAKFVFHRKITLEELIRSIFPITGGEYWFVSAYAVLILLVPLLNCLIRSMNQKEHFRASIILIAVFSIVPTFAFWSRNFLTGGTNFIWFIVLYFIASYVRLYHDKQSTKKYLFAKWTCGYLIFIFGGGLLSRLIIGGLTAVLLGKPTGEGVFYAYNSIVVFPASVCLFMAFKNLKIKNKAVSKAVAGLGSVCFGVYLLTDHKLIRESLWRLADLPRLAYNEVFCVIGVLVTCILLFMFGCFVEFLRKKMVGFIRLDRVINWVDRFYFKMLNNFENINGF